MCTVAPRRSAHVIASRFWGAISSLETIETLNAGFLRCRVYMFLNLTILILLKIS